jgi:hypothetical protein
MTHRHATSNQRHKSTDSTEKKPKIADASTEVQSILARLSEFVVVDSKRQKALQSAVKLFTRVPPVLRVEHAANVAAFVSAAVDGVSDEIVCFQLHAEYFALIDSLLTRREFVALDAAAIDDLRFRCAISHALHTDDSFDFGNALGSLRAEILRCCDLLQRAKLDDAEPPADVTATRAAALFAALGVVHAQASVPALRSHAAALLKDAVAAANRAPTFFNAAQTETLLGWRADASSTQRISNSAAGVARLVKDARAEMGRERASKFSALESRIASSTASKRGHIER